MSLETELNDTGSRQTSEAPVARRYATSRLSKVKSAGRAVVSAACRQADLLLAIVLLLFSANLRSLLSSPTPAWQFNFLDHSWAFDFVTKTRQGIWLGDKVTFTYGPLFQLLASASVNAFGDSLGAFLRSWHLLQVWAGVLLTFFTGRLLLAGHSPLKRSFYLLGLVGFWAALDLRFCFDFFAFAVALRYFDRLCAFKVLSTKSAFAMALVILAGFLISADTGAYALAGFIVAAFAHLLVHRREHDTRKTVIAGATAAGATFLLLALLVPLAMPHARFGFWANSLDAVSQYRWTLTFPMDKPVKWRLITAGAICLLVLTMGYRWRDSGANSLSRRPAFFIAAILFSFVTLQSAVVRSDWGHVSLALLPAMALAGAVLMGSTISTGRWREEIPMIAALALTAAFTGPMWWLQPRNIIANLRIPSAAGQACPPGMFYIDDACLSKRDYDPLHSVSQHLRNHLAEGEAVAIFPYENVYADVARRPVAGGVLQNYQVAGERLTHRQLDGLERDRPKLAVYSADGLATFGLDGVPNLTRTPEVWLYLQSRFTKQAEPVPGIAILTRDNVRQGRWRSEVVEIGSASETEIQLKREIPVNLQQWPENTDLLRLRVRVKYPFWWRISKPAALSVILRLADNTKKVIRAVVPPNETADLWIYPWNEAHLLRYFESDQANWRSGRPRPPVSSLALRFERHDWLSTTPERVNIYGVQGVHLLLNSQN